MSDEQKKDTRVLRFYNCPYCKKTHEIDLSTELIEGSPQSIFPYVFLHSSMGELSDLLTTLYLDRDLQIRSVEVLQVENANIFSKELTRKITEKLMDMITKLEEENLDLRNLLENLDISELSRTQFEEEEEKIKIYLTPQAAWLGGG